MEPLGVAAGHPAPSCHRLFGDMDQAGSGTHPTPFVQMIDNRCRIFLRDLGIAPRCAASLGALLAAEAATQEPDAVLAIACAHGEMVLARETQPLACGVDTRERIEVGSRHAVLLEHSWSLSRGLHTTRRFLSTYVMITGHYL